MVRFICFLATAFIIQPSFAQLREIPKEVKATFESQYPKAEKTDYKDNLIDVHVVFYQDSAKWVAKYNNKGGWKETEKEWNYDQVDETVKDGFTKSKYADWEVKETAIIYQPDGQEIVRVKVAKNDIQKKYLFFTKNGRLVRDSITI